MKDNYSIKNETRVAVDIDWIWIRPRLPWIQPFRFKQELNQILKKIGSAFDP